MLSILASWMGEKGTDTKSHSLLQGRLTIIISKSSIFVFYATLEWTKESASFPPSGQEREREKKKRATYRLWQPPQLWKELMNLLATITQRTIRYTVYQCYNREKRMEKRMEKRIERIKAHSSAVYRKDSPPKAPRFFVLLSTPSLCGTELFAVTPQGNGRVGRCGRGSKRKRSSLSF
jgi:hypothetical protein